MEQGSSAKMGHPKAGRAAALPQPPAAGWMTATGSRRYMPALLSTVTARRFCDQQEMSLQVATGRSLP